MPAANWNTIWENPVSKIKQGDKTRFVTRYYLKQHKKSKQVRLIQWLKDIETKETFYGNTSLWHFVIDLKRFLKSIGKRIKKQYKKCP
jgi:hypothetical protein